MHSRAIYLFLILCAAIAGPMLAQEGHPLVGSWHGDFGPNAKDRTDITLVVDWDGKAVSGIMNPGFEQMALQNAKLDPKGWLVHFEVDRKEGTGVVRCIADGKIDKLGSDRRTITGAFNCGTRKADFKITRDRDY